MAVRAARKQPPPGHSVALLQAAAFVADMRSSALLRRGYVVSCEDCSLSSPLADYENDAPTRCFLDCRYMLGSVSEKVATFCGTFVCFFFGHLVCSMDLARCCGPFYVVWWTFLSNIGRGKISEVLRLHHVFANFVNLVGIF